MKSFCKQFSGERLVGSRSMKLRVDLSGEWVAVSGRMYVTDKRLRFYMDIFESELINLRLTDIRGFSTGRTFVIPTVTIQRKDGEEYFLTGFQTRNLRKKSHSKRRGHYQRRHFHASERILLGFFQNVLHWKGQSGKRTSGAGCQRMRRRWIKRSQTMEFLRGIWDRRCMTTHSQTDIQSCGKLADTALGLSSTKIHGSATTACGGRKC